MEASFVTKALLSLTAWTQILNGPSPPQEVFSPADIKNGRLLAERDALIEEFGKGRTFQFETDVRNGEGSTLAGGRTKTACVMSLETGSSPEDMGSRYFPGGIDPALLRLPGTAQDWRDAVAFHEGGHCQPEQNGKSREVQEYLAQGFAGTMAQKAHDAGADSALDVAAARRGLYAIAEMMSGRDYQHSLAAIAPLPGERPLLKGDLNKAGEQAARDIQAAKDEIYFRIGQDNANPFDRIEALVMIRDNPALRLTVPQKEALLTVHNQGTEKQAAAFLKSIKIPADAQADYGRELRTSLINRGGQLAGAHPELAYEYATKVLERGIQDNPTGRKFVDNFIAGASLAPGYFNAPESGRAPSDKLTGQTQAFGGIVPVPAARPTEPRP